jgi:hypothetical protein
MYISIHISIYTYIYIHIYMYIYGGSGGASEDADCMHTESKGICRCNACEYDVESLLKGFEHFGHCAHLERVKNEGQDATCGVCACVGVRVCLCVCVVCVCVCLVCVCVCIYM